MPQQMNNEYVNFGEFTLDKPFGSSDTEFFLTAVLAEYDMERDREGGIIQEGRISLFGKDDDRVREVIAYSGVITNGQESDGRKKFILQVAIADDGSTLMRGLANDDDGTDDVNNVIAENIQSGQYPVNSRVRITVDAAMWARFNNLIDQFSPVNEKQLRQGECVCAGQPVSIDGNDELYPGIDRWVGIAKESKCNLTGGTVTVKYAAIGGLACDGVHDLAPGTRVYAGIEEDPLTAPTAAPLAAGLMPDGDYEYVVTFVQEMCRGKNESAASPVGAVTLANGSAIGSVDLTAIPVGLYMNTVERKIYRKRIGTGAPLIVDYALTATASASSFTASPPGFPPSNTNDVSFATYWVNDLSEPISTTQVTLSYDLGVVQDIDDWTLTWFSVTFHSNNFTIESSLDGISWTQEGAAVTSGYGTGTIAVAFASTVSARHFRFVFAVGSGSDLTYLTVANVTLNGLVTPPGATTYQLVDTIPDNTTTIYTDIKADADLVTGVPPSASQMIFDLGQTDLGTNILVGVAEGTGCVRIFSECNISYFIATTLQAEAGTNNTALMTPLRTYEAFLAFMKDHGAFWVRARMTGFQREIFWSEIHKGDANIEYRVWRSTTYGGLGTLIATVPNGTFDYIDTDLLNGRFYYRVFAFNTSFAPDGRADGAGEAIFDTDGVFRVPCGDYGDSSDGNLVVTVNTNLASGVIYQYDNLTLNGANITLTGDQDTIIFVKNDFTMQNGNININYRDPSLPDFTIEVCAESRTITDPLVLSAGGAPGLGADFAPCLGLPSAIGPTGGAGGGAPLTRDGFGQDGLPETGSGRIGGVGAPPPSIAFPNGVNGSDGLYRPAIQSGFNYGGSGAGAGSHGISRASLTIIIGGDITTDSPSDFVGVGADGGKGGDGGSGDKSINFAINPGGGGGGGAGGSGGNGAIVKMFHDTTSVVVNNGGAFLNGGFGGGANLGGAGGFWSNPGICSPGSTASNGFPGVPGANGLTGTVELIPVN